MLYLDNLEASIVVLRKLSDEWKEHSVKDPKGDRLRETLSSFKQKVICFRHSGQDVLILMHYNSIAMKSSGYKLTL